MDKKRLLELAGVQLNEDALPIVKLAVTIDAQYVGDKQLTNKELKTALQKHHRWLEEEMTSAVFHVLEEIYGEDKIDGVVMTVKIK